MSASGIGNSTLIGDGSLQYYFVDDLTSPSIVSHNEYWDSSTKQFKCDAGIIQHRTLGVNYASSSTSDSSSHYLYWSLPAYNSAVLTDTNKVYYLYIKAYKTLDEDDDNYQAANFMLSETALGLNSDDDYYYLLTGVLTSETNGNRSYAPKYGMTLIEAGRMIIDRLQGNNFGSGGMLIDLLNNVINMGADGSLIAPSVTFKKADGSEAELSDVVDAVETDITHINDDSTFSINEKLTTRIEWEKISGLANVDHNPSNAGADGSYKKTIAAAEGVLAAGTITTEVPIDISIVKEDIPADYNDAVWSKVGTTYISPSGIYDDDFSGMKLRFTSNAETTITIDWTVDSEDGYDYLVIGPVDSELFGYDPSGEENSEVFQESGELSGTIQRTIPAGESFIEVRYDKDSSGYSGADQATITLSYPSTVEVETEGPNELVQTLTSKYQALLDLFAYTPEEDDSYEGLALYEDINTPFTRSDLSEALAAYDNAESAVRSAVSIGKATESVDYLMKATNNGALYATGGLALTNIFAVLGASAEELANMTDVEKTQAIRAFVSGIKGDGLAFGAHDDSDGEEPNAYNIAKAYVEWYESGQTGTEPTRPNYAVSESGKVFTNNMNAKNADIQGNISANSGDIGGFEIADGRLGIDR